MKGVRRATSDSKTSDVETGDSRTSNSRISLFKGLHTIGCTQKLSLRGLGINYVRDLSTKLCPLLLSKDMSDIFYILNIPEVIHHHVITVTSCSRVWGSVTVLKLLWVCNC